MSKRSKKFEMRCMRGIAALLDSHLYVVAFVTEEGTFAVEGYCTNDATKPIMEEMVKVVGKAMEENADRLEDMAKESYEGEDAEHGGGEPSDDWGTPDE